MVGDIYSVGTDFCFRMPDLRRLDEEVDELMGSDVPTTRGTSACASGKRSVRGAASAAEFPVKQVTAEERRIALKRSSVSLENRGSTKRKNREHEMQIMLHRYVHFHSSETSRGATLPARVCGASHGMLDLKETIWIQRLIEEACGRREDQIRLRSTCAPGTATDVWAGTCSGVVRTRIWIRPTSSRPDGEQESRGTVGLGQGMCYQ